MLFYVVSFFLAIPSPIIFVINSEGWAAFVGLTGARPWAGVALALALGQTVCFSALYFGGHKLVARLPKVQRRLERFDAERYRPLVYVWISLAALIGLPPMIAMSALASGLGVSFPALFGLALAGRFARFSLLAALPSMFTGGPKTDWIPEWLRALV